MSEPSAGLAELDEMAGLAKKSKQNPTEVKPQSRAKRQSLQKTVAQSSKTKNSAKRKKR